MAGDRDPLIYEFGEFSVDTEDRLLTRTGQQISLTPKVFDTLLVLIENRGETLDKDRLMKELWADSFVEEANIAQNIAVLRRAIGEKAKENRFIATVPGRGYRFVAEVRVSDRRDRPGAALETRSATIREFPHLVPRSGNAALAVAEAETEPEQLPEHVSDEPTVLQPVVLPTASPKRLPLFRSAMFAAAAVALVVAGIFIYRKAISATPVDTGAKRLAVLPLAPVNGDKRDAGLELAIVDSLILKLAETKVFQVSQLSTVRSYADLDIDPLDAGRTLDVDYVLASNYQIADSHIRVTSQLIDVTTGATEHTYKSESTTANLFAMQDAIANEIGNAVLARFGKPATTYASARGTPNEEAANLFYEAFYLVEKNNRDDSAKAADLLGQAVLLDPNYAQAWALRAQAYCQFAHRGGGKPDQVFTIAEPMLDKALTLDRDNATALLVKGIIDRDYHWKFDDAYTDLHRAVEADPESWFARRELAVLFFLDGRFDQAVEQLKKGSELNPTNVSIRWLLGLNQIEAGQRDEGVAHLKRVIEMDPSFMMSYDTLWQLYHREGDGANAYANFIKVKELYGTRPEHMSRLKTAYARGGWPAVLRAEFDQMKQEDHKGEYSGSKYYIADLAALNGDRDAAFDYLEESLRFRLIGLSWIKVDHRLDSLRDDPRFADLVKRTGI